ncbi:MAG: hypothetical protein MUO54_15245, partial [Anaerolineales bacterium]|nr:hypothetical protein [Anaerolineales bacterium]
MDQQELHRLKTLKSIFPEESWPWAITALRRSTLIWEKFDSAVFSQDLVQDIGMDPAEWTPGRICAVILARDESEPLSFPIESFDELSAELKGKVHQVYQDYEGSQDQSTDLVDGFLLALALLSEKNTGKSWQEIIAQFSIQINWQFPLVILFNLVDDQVEYLRILDPELALQVLLSNPLTPDMLVDLLVLVTGSLDIGDLEKWFSVIKKEVPDLTAVIAQALLTSLNLATGSIQEILILSFLNQLAGNGKKALNLLEEAAEQNQKLQGKVTANLNKVKSHLDEPQVSDKSWQDLKGSLSNEDSHNTNLTDVAEIIRSLLQKNQHAAAGDLIGTLPDPLPLNPDLALVMAEYAQSQKQYIRAEQYALQALELSQEIPLNNLSAVLLK